MATKIVPKVTNGAASNTSMVQLLRDQVNTLYSSVEQTMRQNILDNSGKLSSASQLPGASHTIVDAFLQFLADDLSAQQMEQNLNELLADGLGAQSAVAITDILYETSCDMLSHSGDFLTLRLAIQKYRQKFIHQYIQTRTTQSDATRKEVKASIPETSTQIILDSVTIPLLISSVKSGIILFANQPLSDMALIPLDQMVGRQTPDFYVNPEERQKFLTDLAANRTVTNYELMLKRGNGEPFNGLISARIFNYGNEPSILATIIDITERKLAETTLRSSQTQLAEAFKIAKLGNWEFNPSTNTFTFSDQFYALFRTNAQEQGGYTMSAQQYVERFVYPEDIPFVTGTIGQSLASPLPDINHQLEHRIVYSDGEIGYVAVNIQIQKDADGQSIKVFGANQDITERKRTEIALLTSQAQLAETLRIAKLANWEYDALTDTFTFNDQFYALLRTTAEQQGGYILPPSKYAEQFVHPEDVSVVAEEIGKLIATNDPDYKGFVEHRIIYGDGEVGHVAVNFRIQKNTEGQTVKAFGTNQDITERKRAEIALLASQTQLAEALKIAQLANWEYDVFTDTFTFNDQFYALLRTTAEQQGGYNMSSGQYAGQFVHPEDAPLVGEEIGKAITTADPNYSGQVEHRVIYGDGEIGYVAVNFRIQKDGEGRTVKTFGANQDITERKRAEIALLTSQGQLAQALRIARLANWEYDVFTDTFTFNDQFYALLRTTAEQQGGYTMSSGQYAGQFVHPEDAPLVGEEIGKAITTADPNYSGQVEHRVIYGDGEIGYAAVNFRIQKDGEGRTVKTFGANQDITERKLAEILREKQAHELGSVAQISTAVATTLDTQKLLQDVVDLTKSHFKLYHAHIYLLNESGDTLVLTAGAGDVGKQMVAEGRQILTSQEQSLVARAVRTRRGVIVNDVQGEPGFLPNALLPNTRSELASPMIVGDLILGVLDVQSDEVNHFAEEDINIQTTLAAQVAIALQNARSFERSEKALQEMNMLTRRLTREGWDNYLMQGFSTPTIDYVYGSEEVLATVDTEVGGETAVSHLISPLTIQGEMIGQLILDDPQNLTDEAVDILEAVAERLSTHIESLRLTEQTQQALAQTETLYKGIDRIVRATTLDEVLSSLLQSSSLFQQLDRANVMFFNRPWQTDLPESATVATVWEKNDQPSPGPVGTVYQLATLPFTRLLDRSAPTVVQNAATDQRVDENTRALLLQRLKMQSVIFVPLTVSNECIGFFTGQAAKPLKLSEDEIRQINSLTDQAATVIQNQRLFEQTQAALAQTEAQARSLSVINQIAQTVAQQIDPILLLESVYEQIRQLMPADAFIVGLYNAQNHVMEFPIVYDDGQRYEQAPSPPSPASNFYKVVLSGESVMINRTPEEVEERQKRAAQNTLGNTAKISASLAYVPLTIGQQTLGAMSVQSYHYNAYEPGDISMLNGIANHVAVALENARLFEQTQVALAETGALYQTSTHLNSATSLEETLQAAVEPAKASGASSGSLFRIDLDEDGQPAWAQLIAYSGEEQIIPLGSRFELKTFPFSKLWLSDPGNAILISDVETDERLDLVSRSALLQTNIKATVIMGLLVGSRWIGQIVISWAQPYNFTSTEHRLYNTIAAQAAAMVDNFLLFEQERQRTAQLELLAQVDVALSLADSEDKILQPLVEAFPASDLVFASLVHVNSDAAGKPVNFDLVSLWSHGMFLPEIPDGFQGVLLEAYPLSKLWLYAVENLVVIEDVQQDTRADEAVRMSAEQQGWRSLAMLPLRISGRWQGLITFNWSTPHKLTATERFLLEGVLETVSAIVTTRRAQLSQQLALQETEILYKAAAELNVAQNYEQVLGTLRQYTVLGQDSNNISLNYFDKPWTSAQEPEWIDVLGRWSLLPPENVMPRYQLSAFPSANRLLQIDGPTVIEDVVTDVRLDDNVRALYMKRLLAQSTIFVPLVVGGQWLGYINAVYPQHTTFQETELKRLAVIGGQAAVAIQTIRLLEETNRLFAQEQLRTQELTVLNQMARELTLALDVNEVVEKLYLYTAQLMDAQNFYVALYNHPKKEISFPIALEEGKKQQWRSRAFGNGMTEYVIRNGQGLLIEKGVDNWLQSQGIDSIGHPSQSWLGMPLQFGNEVLGVIALQSTQPNVYSHDHFNLLQAVASQGTIALQNAKLFQQTQQRAQHEQILREIATKVRSSSDVDTVMRTAVQEIGRALGRRSFVYLDNPLEKES